MNVRTAANRSVRIMQQLSKSTVLMNLVM